MRLKTVYFTIRNNSRCKYWWWWMLCHSGASGRGVCLHTVSTALSSSQASQDLFEERTSAWQGDTNGRSPWQPCISTHWDVRTHVTRWFVLFVYAIQCIALLTVRQVLIHRLVFCDSSLPAAWPWVWNDCLEHNSRLQYCNYTHLLV